MCNIKNILPRSETHFLKRSVLKFFFFVEPQKNEFVCVLLSTDLWIIQA